MSSAEGIEALGRDLVVEKGFAPLERVLPAAGAAAGLFNACLARLDSGRLEVHALLAWRGQDSADLQARASALRRALEAGAAGLGQRVGANFIVVAENEAEASGAELAMRPWQEGHFLQKVLLAPAVASLRPPRLARSGRMPMVPGQDWFEERLASGSPHSAAEAEEQLGRGEQEEARSRRLLSRGETRATWALIALNCAAYIASRLHPQLFELGQNQGRLTFGLGEPWRLLSCMFLHAGELHLAFNMVSLFSLGTLLERLSGPWKFLLLYFIPGLLGSLLSALSRQDAASVGASGAIFGLAGALLALNFRRPRDFPKSLAGRIFGSLARPVAFTLLLGMGLSAWGGPIRFDNWAHFGGLLGGFGLAWLRPSLLQKPLRKSA